MIDSVDHLALRALYAEYNRSIDAGDANAWADTFVQQGEFVHPSKTFRGRAELKGFVEARTQKLADHPVAHQRHWNDGLSLAPHNGGVKGRCELLVVGLERGTTKALVVAQGHYEDLLAKEDNQWRFLRRMLTVS